jgi:phage FluMu protein Com
MKEMQFRCKHCSKLLAKFQSYSVLEIKCPRCGCINRSIMESQNKIEDPILLQINAV